MRSLLPLTLMAALVGCDVFDGREDPDPEPPIVDEVPEVPPVSPPQCQSDADCDDGETCWVNPAALWSRCVPACEVDADCDDGQLCRTMFDARACVDPQDDEEPLPPPVDVEDGLPIAPTGITCFGPVNNEILEIPFSLGADTTSAMVVPFTADGGPMAAIALTVPDGRTFDLQAPGNNLLAVTASLIGTTAPLFLPQFPAAEELVQPGDYIFSVAAITEDLCAYVVPETSEAEPVLDLNVYYVGIEGLDAASAPDDPGLQAALDVLESTFAGADIEIGVVRHFDADPDVADEFATIVDVDAQPGPLVSTSEPPGADDDALLSVNVFLVAEFDDGGVIGISQGIPGPIGLHGAAGSGVVMTAEFLDFIGGPELTGQILAHELGHWLGLFHSTEIAGGVFDPLADTPPCLDIAEFVANGTADQCPDFLNLMFPFANPAATTVTPEQAGVLLANPVTR
ncbi:MAG: hypothetical protein AAF211_27815 [Myxococcota bacterium]